MYDPMKERLAGTLAPPDQFVVNAEAISARTKVIMNHFLIRHVLWLGFLCLASILRGHTPADSFLQVAHAAGVITGRADLPLRELEDALGLDEDANGEITWGEVKARALLLDRYLNERLHFRTAGERGELRVRALRAEYHGEAAYASLEFAVDGLST